MRLAATDLPAAADTKLYAPAVGRRAIVTLSACNRTAASIRVRVALTGGPAPVAADWIEYDAPIGAGGVLERTGLALGAGQALYARADAPGLSLVVYGVEEAA